MARALRRSRGGRDDTDHETQAVLERNPSSFLLASPIKQPRALRSLLLLLLLLPLLPLLLLL